MSEESLTERPGVAPLPLEELLLGLEVSDTALWGWDLATGGLMWTSVCYRMLDVDVAAGHPLHVEQFFQRVHVDDRDRVHLALQTALASRAMFAEQFRVVHRSGEVRWIKSHARALYDTHGKPLKMLGSARDVTAEVAVTQSYRDVQERLELTVEASGLGTWALDVATQRLDWSPRCYRIHGVSESEFGHSAHDFWKLVHPEDVHRIQQAFGEALASKQPFVDEFRIVRPDGTIAWVANRARARYADDGSPVMVLGTVGDITELKQNELSLRAALSASQTGTFRWDMDEDRVTWDSELGGLIFASSSERTAPLRRFIEHILPEDREAVWAAFTRCQQVGSPLNEEFRVRLPDGDVRWLYARAEAYQDHRGRPTWVTGACVDVTLRKRAELDCRASEARFKTAVAAASDILWTNDAHGRMTPGQSSWQAFTGQKPEQYEGLGWLEAIHPEDALATLDAWRKAVDSESRFVFEHRVRRHDGVYRFFAVRALPVTDERGQVREWVGVHTDITEVTEARCLIEQQNKELRELDSRKDVFLATLSHELRNPLAPIRTVAELFARKNATPAQLEQARSVLQRQVKHMALLLDDLLDVSRITQGKLVLKKDFVSLEAAVESAIEVARPLIDKKAHRLTVQIPDPSPVLHADFLRLSQVLSNLLTNAAKYTERGGLIQLRADAKDGEVLVEVKDNGIGVDPGQLEKLFEMFRQLDTPGGQSEGGLGLGLAIVRGLVELHGGSVKAHSDGLGRGTTVALRLPACEGPPAAVSSRRTAGEHGQLRILVVDDNVDAADTLATLLQLAGHCVHATYDPHGGLAAVDEFKPDLVLLDIGMPGMSGLDVASRIRTEHRSAPILVALTGWGQPQDRERAKAAGFDYHFTKPLDVQDLEQVIAAHLARLRS